MIASLGDTKISKIEIPDSIYMLGDMAMASCRNLEEVVLPDSITYIGNAMFFENKVLKKVTLPSGLENIPEMTFIENTSLESITIPSSVKNIGWSAFEKCEKLTNVVIPDGVESIGMFAFRNCSALKEVTIPASVECIGWGAFDKDNTGLVIKGYTGSAAESYAKENNIKFQSIGTIDPDVVATEAPTSTPAPKPTAPVAPTANPEETVEPTAEVLPTNEASPSANPGEETAEPEESAEPDETADPEETVEPTATATVKPTATPEESAEPTIAPKGYVITLNANGGTVEKDYITVMNGSTYDDLPYASRAGYIFAGWFTEIEGGTKIENVTSVNLTSDQTLYAHWIAEECEVTFDAAGGSVSGSQDKKVVLFGDVFGEMPEAKKSGATFLGWYTSKEGGSLITEDMLVNFTGKVTLFAHWENTYKQVTGKSLTYKFDNSNQGFKYPSDYEIPLSVFQYMYGNTTYAKELYASEGIWAGNCFGMSSSSIMFNVDGDDVEVSNYSAKSTLPSQLDLTNVDKVTQMTLKRFIEAMQISQYDSDICDVEEENWNEWDDVYNAVKASAEGKGEPVIVCVYGPEGGHAIVGYKTDDTGIYVYDPNYPNDETRKIKITKNSKGNVTSWYYHLNDTYDWGSEYDDCGISFVPYDVFYQVWAKNGAKCFNALNMLRVSSDNVKILDETGKEVAQVVKGELVSNDPDITQIQSKGVAKDGNAEKKDVELFIPAKKYTIVNTGSDKQFTANILGTDVNAQVTTEASKITINIDDLDKENQIMVHAKSNEKYQVTLKSMALHDKGNVVVEGKGSSSGDVEVSQSNGDIQLVKCDNANIKVNGKSASSIAINAKSGNGGSISREGNIGTIKGEDVVYAITPDYGYMVKDVVVDGVSQGNITSYAFENVSKTHTIEATFEKADLTKASVRVLSKKVVAGETPDLEVRIGQQILAEKDDYVVKCKNVTGSKMTLEIEGKSFYSGTITKVVDITDEGSNGGNTDSGNTDSGNTDGGNTDGGNTNGGNTNGGDKTDKGNTVKKGSSYKVGSFTYKVTDLSGKKVTLTKKAKSTKTVTVPATVKIKGKTFKVTAIGTNVWKNDKTLQSITIGKNVTSIGANAMSGAKNLKKITVTGTVLKTVGKNALKNISAKAVIKVPKSKKASYKRLFKGKGQKKTVTIK